jgi:hypothetical protein
MYPGADFRRGTGMQEFAYYGMRDHYVLIEMRQQCHLPNKDQVV